MDKITFFTLQSPSPGSAIWSAFSAVSLTTKPEHPNFQPHALSQPPLVGASRHMQAQATFARVHIILNLCIQITTAGPLGF